MSRSLAFFREAQAVCMAGFVPVDITDVYSVCGDDPGDVPAGIDGIWRRVSVRPSSVPAFEVDVDDARTVMLAQTDRGVRRVLLRFTASRTGRSLGIASLGPSHQAPDDLPGVRHCVVALTPDDRYSGQNLLSELPLDTRIIVSALAAAALMNVRNVGTVEQTIPRWARKRLHSADGDASSVRYKTLVLRPLHESEPKSGATRPAHLPFSVVRGHYATYTEESKLFGRYVGTYWIEAHSRGSKAFGEIIKTYRIDPTEEAA